MPALLTNLALSSLLFAVLWRVSVRIKDPSFIDAWWAGGIVVLATASLAQAKAPGAHAWALFALASAWGARLGLYLLGRWRAHGKDRRYAGLEAAAAKQGLGFSTFALAWVFAPQCVLQFIVALPVMAGIAAPAHTMSALGWSGAALGLFGIAYEAIADAQLTRFKANPANAGKVMDRGLWRFSRHPNYFGELCAWWGMYLIALDAGVGWSAVGPLLLSLLLTRVSGAPTTEPHLKRTRPEYDAYKQRTSAFIPWPPGRG